ncbi:hypothetical protein ACFLQW_02015 [Candidatus Zixiibacteriota bacterium]
MARKISAVLLLTLFAFSLFAASAFSTAEQPKEKVKFKHRFPTQMTIEEAMVYEQRVGDRSEFAADAEEDQSFVPGNTMMSPAEIKDYPIPPNAIYSGETTYDYQWNGSSHRSISHGVDPLSGKRYIHVVWMALKVYILTDPSRNVHYNCYDWSIPGWTVSTDGWGGMPVIEAGERGGYAHVSTNAGGNAIVWHHSAIEGEANYAKIARFSIPGMGIYTGDRMTSLAGQENIWSRGAIGSEEIEDPPHTTYEVYHVGAQDSGPGAGDPAYTAYWRYAYDTDLLIHQWEGPVPMSQTMTLSHMFAAQGERVIMAYAHARDYGVGRSQYDNDCVYFESTEAGADWIADGGYDLADVDAGEAWNTTSYRDDDIHRVYLDMSAMFDLDGVLHLLYTTPMYNDEEGTISVGPTIMLHWSEGDTPNQNAQVSGGSPIGFEGGTDAFHSVAAAAMWGSVDPDLANDGGSGTWNRYISKMSLGVGDGSTDCTDPENNNSNRNYLYAQYTLFGGVDVADKEDASASGMQNGNQYISMSNDNGYSWDAGRCLTTQNGDFAQGATPTRSEGCDCPTDDPTDPECADPCMSEHWGSIARLINDTLHCFYIEDYDAGGLPFDEGNWAVNKAVYHPLIGSGTIDSTLCPMIAPVLGVVMTVDLNCEYHGDLADGLDPVDLESLTIENYGNDDLNYSININQLSGDPNDWILIDNGTSVPPSTIPKGGDGDEYQIEMDADETPGKGMYRAELSIDHNDPNPALTDPYVMTISFFVADSFVCGTGTVMTTPCVALTVSNVESWGREDADGGMWYYAENDNDTLYSPIYDASLVIVNKTLSQAGPDVVAYRDIFSNETAGNPGFRALEDLKLSFNAETNESLGQANQVTNDSTIGVTVQYWFPQDPDSCEFVRMKFKIYPNDFSDPDLVVGAAADLDVNSTTLEDDGSARTSNGDMGGWIPSYNMIYAHGTEEDTLIDYPDTSDVTTQYAAGMTALTCQQDLRAVVQSNRNYVYPEGGYTDEYLLAEFDSTGVTIWVDQEVDANGEDFCDDIHVLLAWPEITLTESAWDEDGCHVFQLAMVTSTVAAEDVNVADYTSPYDGYVTDLKDKAAMAWKKGFGWCGGFAVNAPPLDPDAYPYELDKGGVLYLNATGTHEDGLGSCCGCDFTTVPAVVVPPPTTGSITVVDDGDCHAHLAVSGDCEDGSYTVTVTVQDLCGDQVDELTFDIVVAGGCDCGIKGDVNFDASTDPLDVSYIVNAVYLSLDAMHDYTATCPYPNGDVNCDDSTDPLDVSYLVNAVYLSLDAMCDRCP